MCALAAALHRLSLRCLHPEFYVWSDRRAAAGALGKNSRDGNVKQKSDSGENEVDCQQEHSEIFGDVHGSFLRQTVCICTLKKMPRSITFAGMPNTRQRRMWRLFRSSK